MPAHSSDSSNNRSYTLQILIGSMANHDTMKAPLKIDLD